MKEDKTCIEKNQQDVDTDKEMNPEAKKPGGALSGYS